MTAPTSPLSPQPGWYPDPYRQGLRWWDGATWSPHARPLPAAAPDRPAPPAHAGHNEGIGRLMMIAQAAGTVLLAAGYGWAGAAVLRDLGPLFDALTAPAGSPPPEVPASLLWLGLVSVLGLVAWVPRVLEMMWAYRAASAAAALGIPARREPIWAVVAWFLPVVSLWFPYQSVRDCLPPEHPRRRTVALWWAGSLVSDAAVVLALGGALLGGAMFAVVMILVTAVAVATAVLGLRVTRAVDEAHRELLPAG
ncbi:MAG TPA: DUF4328 domain-containing protein [Pseudonocardiaceae bacterium]